MNYFSAKEPSLGYLYQIRYALYLLLKSDNESYDILLSLESLDDIAIEKPKEGTDLFQTKYHPKSIANLTDASPDFWKTIRVWSNGIKDGTINLNNTIFTLISTAEAPIDSISYKLRPNLLKSRDEKYVFEKMLEIAQNSKNKTNLNAYEDFINLTDDQKKSLISKIQILESSVDIILIKKEILNQLKYTTKKEFLEPFYERLEGWWLDLCIHQLSEKRQYISSSELQNKMWEIQDQFKSDNLPIDKLNINNINEGDLEKNQRLFINQLKIIHLNEKRLSIAIRDFYRTFTQRSTWVRQNLLYPDEEENYDSKLIENWERRFEIMKDEFNTESSNDDLAKVGNAFYTSYEKSPPQIYIRPRVTNEFLVLGSYHMLANELNIGWHPKYDELLINKTKDQTL
jgi:hypothetical protein